jgi:hypothetical protein
MLEPELSRICMTTSHPDRGEGGDAQVDLSLTVDHRQPSVLGFRLK